MFKPLPITLQRGALRLEPLVEADIPELVSLAEANREALQNMDGPTRPDWYRQSLAEQREGRALPLAVRLGVQLVGTTRFAEFLPALPACEIGWTWLDQAQHG
ncbi:MAG: GNAT family N-acetyltransferase, partial [Enterobacter sp.]|nr:GNAT family N-acetyltransferase [Enterobacter sp.]